MKLLLDGTIVSVGKDKSVRIWNEKLEEK